MVITQYNECQTCLYYNIMTVWSLLIGICTKAKQERSGIGESSVKKSTWSPHSTRRFTLLSKPHWLQHVHIHIYFVMMFLVSLVTKLYICTWKLLWMYSWAWCFTNYCIWKKFDVKKILSLVRQRQKLNAQNIFNNE